MKNSRTREGWALLSGGKDSTLSALTADSEDRLKGVVYIDTGIGLEETRQYVEDLSNDFGWELKIFKGYVSYDSYILRHGFPTPAGHSQIMHILKLDAVRRFISWAKKEYSDIPLIYSGVRSQESDRRSRWARRFQHYQGADWDCPIFHYSDEQVWKKHFELNVPINSSYGIIGKSGDCLCGAFGNLSEKRMIEKYYPYLSDHIKELEEQTTSTKYNIWGNTEKSICALRAEAKSENLLCNECIVKSIH